MTLAEKIAFLRKDRGWSQEELAEKLNVSRQSVSKWESGASTPELDRIVEMCRLFNLTADALIRDDLAPDGASACKVSAPERPLLTLDDAYAYLSQFQVVARRIAWGVAACIVSPAPLMLLEGATEWGMFARSRADALGVPLLLLIVGWAVWQFVAVGGIVERYRYIEKKRFTAAPGVCEWVRQSREEFQPVFARYIAIGVMLCVVSPAPLIFLESFFSNQALGESLGVALLLLIVAAGVGLIVLSGTLQNCYHRLLKEKTN